MSQYREQLEKWLSQQIVRAKFVYDIGGGAKPVKGRTASWEVEDYKILDLPDFDLDKPLAGTWRQADVIFCLEVFEYLINPLCAMRNINALLRGGGRAVISCPLIYPLHNEVDRDSLRYTETGIKRLAKAAGLYVAKINYRQDISGSLVEFYGNDKMKCARGFDHRVTGYIVELAKPERGRLDGRD